MKKNIVAVAMLCASTVSAIAIAAPAKAQMSDNYIGPSLSIGGGNTVLGIDAKFGVSENLSLRPFVSFPSGGTNFGTSLTYDFTLPQTSRVKITPFLGGGLEVLSGGSNNNTQAFFTGGADFGVTENVSLKAALEVPIGNTNGATTSVILGAGFRF
jgi:opacity protein-like surface antigen